MYIAGEACGTSRTPSPTNVIYTCNVLGGLSRTPNKSRDPLSFGHLPVLQGVTVPYNIGRVSYEKKHSRGSAFLFFLSSVKLLFKVLLRYFQTVHSAVESCLSLVILLYALLLSEELLSTFLCFLSTFDVNFLGELTGVSENY